MGSWQTSGDNGGRSSARRELVMAEIRAQAAKLFAERGFPGTSLQDVADATGMSRQALYHYVKSKDELFTHLVTDITRSTATKLRAINDRVDLDATAKLRAIAKAIAIYRAKEPHHFLLAVRSEGNLSGELDRAHKDGKRAVLNEIVKVVEAGIDTGEFRLLDARLASLSILGMLNWVAWWFNPDGRDSPESVADYISDLAVAVVAQTADLRADPTDAEGALAVVREDLDILERAVKMLREQSPPS